MIKFEYEFDDDSPRIEMTLQPTSTLPQVLQSFEAFLRASGYVFNGMVDIIDDNDIECVDGNVSYSNISEGSSDTALPF